MMSSERPCTDKRLEGVAVSGADVPLLLLCDVVLCGYIDDVQLGQLAQLPHAAVRRLVGHSDGQVAHVLAAEEIHPRTPRTDTHYDRALHERRWEGGVRRHCEGDDTVGGWLAVCSK